MRAGISTHMFLQQRLHPGILDTLARVRGLAVIELFAARHHFDFHDRQAVHDIAAWFRSNEIAASLHQPIFLNEEWSRHTEPTLNLIDPDKSKRIAAMDEVKRALEIAEHFPLSAMTMHLGRKDDAWNTRALENSMTAIEHLQAFARPLGVRLLLENLQNDVTTPEHLLEIVKVGHFDDIGFTLDLGHAHLSQPGILSGFEFLGNRIAQADLHDNNGTRDEHFWPGDAAESAGIDWQIATNRIDALDHSNLNGILEISHEIDETPESAARKAADFFERQQERLHEALRERDRALDRQHELYHQQQK